MAIKHAAVVEMAVEMPTQKQERKIRKLLKGIRGVHSVEVDFLRQKVSVTGCVDPNKILKKVKEVSPNADFWRWQFGGNFSAYGPYQDVVPSFGDSANYSHEGKRRKKKKEEDLYYDSYGRPVYDPDYASERPPPDDGVTTIFSDENPNACSVM